MATISFRVSEDDKNVIYNYAKSKNVTMSEYILSATFSKMEDEEDYLLGEARMLDPENKITGDLRKLAKECGIDYDEL